MDIKKLAKYIGIALVIGFIGNLLGGNTDIYSKINTPSFAPPAILFPIVWGILYVLMGISAYRVSNTKDNNKALTIYYIQLAVNALWSLFFFRFNFFLFSALWLALLIILVIYMIVLFYKLDKTAAFLQIPYLAWIIFAFVLNFSIYLLN